MDFASLRAEIKTWERAFKAENQRNPTIDDIKSLPKIAAKYKLYKKISKEMTSLPSQKEVNGSLPSTPLRRSAPLHGPPSLLPKSRPVTHPVIDATPNPFSPSKSSRKHPSIDEPSFPQPKLLGHRSTSSEKKQTTSTVSAGPPIEGAKLDVADLFATTAFKKARKRLRGDVVSPSPKKPRKVRHSSPVKPDSDDEVPFVDESPVKASSNGKHFKLLFEEAKFQQPDFSKKASFSDMLFGSQTAIAEPSSSKKELATRIKLQGRRPSLAKKQIAKLTPYVGLKSDLHVASPAIDSTAADLCSDSRKRSSSVEASGPSKPPSFNADDLLPPSPPATEESLCDAPIHGSNRNRKKTKLTLSNAVVDEDVTEDGPEVQVIDYDTQSRRSQSRHPVDGDVGDDSGENEPFCRLCTVALDNNPDDALDDAESEDNLPDDLRSLLHISSSQRSAREERALVESLLRGKPGPQDPCGEVWGVGETEEAAATTTDDEWAGEGVPWEVAEL